MGCAAGTAGRRLKASSREASQRQDKPRSSCLVERLKFADALRRVDTFVHESHVSDDSSHLPNLTGHFVEECGGTFIQWLYLPRRLNSNNDLTQTRSVGVCPRLQPNQIFELLPYRQKSAVSRVLHDQLLALVVRACKELQSFTHGIAPESSGPCK